MADNLTTQSATPATVPAASAIATDDIGSVHFQRVKTALGPNGTHTADQAGRDIGSGVGAGYVDNRPSVVEVTATPTITATAYEAKDAIGGLLTFSNAARVSGGSIRIEGATLIDKAQQNAETELVLFGDSISAPTDEAAFDPSDSDLAKVRGRIVWTSDDYGDLTDNCYAHKDAGTTIKLVGTSLYGVLVARGTPTFASTSDITVALTIVQD